MSKRNFVVHRLKEARIPKTLPAEVQTMSRPGWRLLLLLALIVSPCRAQNIVAAPGKTIEVIGLRRWTLQMLQDSMSKYAPGESLASHACAAILRYKLGFAEASATTYRGFIPGDTMTRIVVAVVEPQDSNRVHHRALPMDSTRAFAPWAQAIEIARTSPGTVNVAVQHYPEWLRDSLHTGIPPHARRDSARIVFYWRFLAAHRGGSDLTDARRLLANDPNFRTRAVAASILLNFATEDSTIAALADAIREVDGIVKGIAAEVLRVAAHEAPAGGVDWTPAVGSVHAILDGTSLFELPDVIDALLASRAGPALAPSVLRGGGHALLAFAGSSNPVVSTNARRLLNELAGRDLGDDPRAWEAWLDAL